MPFIGNFEGGIPIGAMLTGNWSEAMVTSSGPSGVVLPEFTINITAYVLTAAFAAAGAMRALSQQYRGDKDFDMGKLSRSRQAAQRTTIVPKTTSKKVKLAQVATPQGILTTDEVEAAYPSILEKYPNFSDGWVRQGNNMGLATKYLASLVRTKGSVTSDDKKTVQRMRKTVKWLPGAVGDAKFEDVVGKFLSIKDLFNASMTFGDVDDAYKAGRASVSDLYEAANDMAATVAPLFDNKSAQGKEMARAIQVYRAQATETGPTHLISRPRGFVMVSPTITSPSLQAPLQEQETDLFEGDLFEEEIPEEGDVSQIWE